MEIGATAVTPLPESLRTSAQLRLRMWLACSGRISNSLTSEATVDPTARHHTYRFPHKWLNNLVDVLDETTACTSSR
jgi:hypothetical protein